MTIFEGPKKHVEEGVSFTQLIFDSFQEMDDSTVLSIRSENDEIFTLNQVEKGAAAIAKYLSDTLGLGQHSMISLLSKNSPYMAIGYLGALFGNVPVAAGNPDFSEDDLKYFFNNNKAELVMLQSDFVDKVEAIRSDIPYLKRIFILEGAQKNGCQHFDNLPSAELKDVMVHVKNPRQTMSMVIYSSGTTGLPKGVLISQYSLYTYLCLFPLRPEQMKGWVTLMLLPMYHIYGAIFSFISMIYGLKLVTMAKFQPTTFLAAIEKYQISNMPLVPTLIHFINKWPRVNEVNFGSLKLSSYSASAIAKEQMKKFMEITKVPQFVIIYAMTEGLSMTANVTGIAWKDGSVGKLAFNVRCKIVDPVTQDEKGINEEGEILVQTPTVMMGYLNNPTATAETIDKDGWIHTGDIGYFDEEGFLFLVDRCKELIKFKGMQVAPAKLECILVNDPRVADAAVIGKPDDYAGEIPFAVVIRNDPSVTEEDLVKLIEGSVSVHERLRGGVIFTDFIPRTNSGKILRRKLREMYCPKS